ncbi:hypothetical protein [Altererythrobacter sp. GH1-8]|uniref:hypothetical protein n=1 Tax=Altererythrobacter sp. GH1-8 TaxID=3349333 RepID=UPI00374D2922
MRSAQILLAALALSQAGCAQASPANETSEMAGSVTDDEIFKAAGFEFSEEAWRKCGDPGTMSYEPGAIMERGDFNGDGLVDALVTEGGTYCFGMAGYGYTLVSQQKDGTWRILDERIGIPSFLETKGTEGWPDIEVGGPGFCFPVIRWNGKEYEIDRTQYEGAPCPQ